MNRFATVSLAGLMLFSLALFVAQVVFSAVWLKLSTQGPLEWLWRWPVKGHRPRLLRAKAG